MGTGQDMTTTPAEPIQDPDQLPVIQPDSNPSTQDPNITPAPEDQPQPDTEPDPDITAPPGGQPT
jgi:hypothetical protein